MRKPEVMAAAAVAALALALLGACGGDDAPSEDPTDSSKSPDKDDDDYGDASSKPSGPNVGSGPKTAVAALDTAEDEVKNGAAFELDLDDDGGSGWDVTVASGTSSQYEVRVSQDGSKMESNNKENDRDDDLGKFADVKLTAQDAVKRAAKDHPGDVTGADFEVEDDGTETWQVTLNDNGSGTEYKLDANSGKTLSEEPED
ncbi:MAG: PepSY domain-containing protein [Stackebrandtia sp.]